MKFRFALSLLFILFSVAMAQAQDEGSLKTLPAGESFTDKEKRFSIRLPREPFDTRTNAEPGKKESAVQHKWLLREGVFFVAVTTFKESSFDTKQDVDAYVAELAEQLKKVTSFKTVWQKPLTHGSFNGAEILRENADGKRIYIRVYAKGRIMYTLTASLDETVEDAEPLMTAALNSFNIAAK
jgi:hypothetical protein